MAHGISHAFTSGKADGGDATKVRASNWNSAHAIDLGWIDVMDAAYGAHGDGVNDDAAHIQSALNAAPANGVVFLPPGTYLVSVPLDKPVGVTLAGAGRAATTVKMQNSVNVAAVIRTNGFAGLTGTTSLGGEFNSEIKNLTVDGNKANNSAGVGIQLYGKYFRIDNVSVLNCTSYGIYTEYAGGDDFTDPLKTLESILTRINVQQCEDTGIYVKGPHDITLSEVVSFMNGGWGIDIITSAHGNDVNTYLNTSGGVRVRSIYGAINYVGALYGTAIVGSTAAGIGLHLASGGNFLAASIASGPIGLQIDANNNVFQGAVCNTTATGVYFSGTGAQAVLDVCMFNNSGTIFGVSATSGGLKSMVRAFMGDNTGTLQDGAFQGSWSINGYTGFVSHVHELYGRVSVVGGRLCPPNSNYGVNWERGLFSDTSAPSSGAFVVGDKVFNSNPSVGQPTSWVCTVAGSPGTWVSEGVLSEGVGLSYSPTVLADTGNLTVNSSATYYSVVGNTVTVMIEIDVTPSSVGTNPSILTVTLPSAAWSQNNTAAFFTIYRIGFGNDGIGKAVIYAGGTVLNMYRIGNQGTSAVDILTTFTYNSRYSIWFQMQYFKSVGPGVSASPSASRSPSASQSPSPSASRSPSASVSPS